MAEEFDPLANMPSQNNTNGPQPFGLKERLISTLIFDTQPKRRSAYVNRLGYELNPKDHNLIKPIGSGDDSYFPIDPGGIFDWSQYTKKGGMSELGTDLLEGALDFLQGSATEATGAGGAVIGAAGGPIGAVVGRSGGRVAMFRAIENMKDSIGDMFLDKEIPPDQALRATQTAIQAVGPEAIRAGGKALKSVASKTFSAVSSGVRKLLSIGDGKIGEQAWQALKENPDLISNEKALSEAGQGITSYIDDLRGTDGNTTNIWKSRFGKEVLSLDQKKQGVLTALDSIPEASINKKDIVKLIETEMMKLSDPSRSAYTSEARNAAISKLSDAAKMISKFPNDKVNFSALDETLKQMRVDAFDSSLSSDAQNALKGVLYGKDGLVNQVKSVADSQADKIPGIANYGEILSKQSSLLGAYDKVKNAVTPSNAKSFIIGDHLFDPTGRPIDDKAAKFTDALQSASDALGVDMIAPLKNKQIQNQFWKAISERGPRGSGGSNIPAMVAGTSTYAGLKSLGAPNEMAVLGGSVVGGTTYGLTQPRLGTRVAIGAENAAQSINNIGPAGPIGDLASQLGTQAVIRSQNPVPTQTPSNDNFDPLNDFDPLKDFGK